MGTLSDIQSIVVLVLGVAALAAEAIALGDALRHRADAYVAAGKRSKTFWTVLLAVAAAVGLVMVFNVLNLFGLLAFVAAAVYLTDVRPALRRVTGRGSGTGPYGPW